MPTIEQNLERIADALEKIAAQGGSLATTVTNVVTQAAPADDGKAAADKAAADKAAADKKAADKKAADEKAAKEKADKEAAEKAAAEEAAAAAALGGDEKPKSTKTKDDVRKALQAYREIEGTPAMLEILKKHGASTLNDLAEDQYDAVVAAVS